MPLYDIRCNRSGSKFERFIPLANFEEPIICACHSPATRLISTPLFSVDKTDYACPVSGKRIGSKREHQENLKQQDCRVLEPGESDQAAKRREADDRALDKAIENTVEREIESYSSAKREQLANELVNGKLDLNVERR